MNTPQNRNRRTGNRAKSTLPAQPGYSEQFEEMPDPLTVVEHLTIPGFIRRAPHRFHIDEITRFGDKVGRVTESLQISYLTTIDRSLGQIRLFPVPLLVRVYQVMAAQFGWEQIVDAPAAMEDRHSAELKANERAKKHLQAAAETANNPVIAQAMTTVLHWLETEAQRLREHEEGTPTPPPLRSI